MAERTNGKETWEESKAWIAYYTPFRHELYVLATKDDSMIFAINGEEIFEAGIDKMTDEERQKYIVDNYSAEIEDILDSRA